MNLRPHHLLCIQKFTGYGYNSEFTEYMKLVVSKLENYPDTQITLVNGCDDICIYCPNNVKGNCTSFEKVDLMDESVLGICGISYGQDVLWSDIAGKVRERIFKTQEFRNICHNCQWFLICEKKEFWYEQQKKIK